MIYQNHLASSLWEGGAGGWEALRFVMATTGLEGHAPNVRPAHQRIVVVSNTSWSVAIPPKPDSVLMRSGRMGSAQIE
jgi:hypothetical protein